MAETLRPSLVFRCRAMKAVESELGPALWGSKC
jgi:hypothetical protein